MPKNENLRNVLFTDTDKQVDLEVSLEAFIVGCEFVQCYFYSDMFIAAIS